MSEDEQSKTLDPTERKLEKAREKGDLPKTADMTAALALLGHWVFAMALGSWFIIQMGSQLMVYYRFDDLAQAKAAGRTLAYVGVMFLLPIACVMGFLVTQKAIVFAPTKLVPKFDRLSPLSNAKQKFGITGLVEFAKSATKLCLYSAVLVGFLIVSLPGIVTSAGYAPAQASKVMMQFLVNLLGIVVLISLCIGFLDYVWQRFDHKRKLKMSHKEVKDEHKESEGDPMMKQSRRQKAMEIAMNQMLTDVKSADVIVVNPTHFSIALSWDREEGRAPKCVAKGQDEVALKIREIAQDHGIPIHGDAPTARALFASVDIGQEVRPDHYEAVAAAIRFADRMRGRA